MRPWTRALGVALMLVGITGGQALAWPDRLEARDEALVEQLLLVRHVVVDGGLAHPEGGRDVIERGVVVAALVELARRHAALVWCDGRLAALEFYRRHGFQPVGAMFETPGTGPHYRLVRLLGGTDAPEELR